MTTESLDSNRSEAWETRQKQEDAFCAAWLRPLDTQRVRIAYFYTIVLQIFLLCAEPFVESYTHLVSAARTIHAMTIPLLILGFIKRKDFVFYRRILWAAIIVIVLSLDVLLIHTARNWLGHIDMLIVFAFHIIIGTYLPHADRIPPWITSLVLSVHSVSLWSAFLPVPMGFVIATVSTICYVFSAAVALSIQRTEARIARVEFQFRTTIVPEHIVRHSATSDLDLSELFKPSSKFCACLSADWRNYQAITSKIPATQLTHSLNSYHQCCQDLAREFFPRGNYYTDWIADELFLVVYAEYPGDERDVVNQIVGFGYELLKGRPEFSRVHGIPSAVDVGISAGSAIVGVMGPDSHRKATALGEVPGIARRLQTLGKSLRQELGQKDRVIFSKEILMLLNQPFDITSYTAAQSPATSDLRDLELYYIDAAESPTQKDPKSA